MTSTGTYEIRGLSDDEIAQLERVLGKPVPRSYLSYWVREAIRDVVRLATPLIGPGEYRDELKQIAQQGRKWIDIVRQSRSTSLLPKVLEVEQLISSVATFSDAVGSLAYQADNSVGPGRPPTHLALEAFLDRLIGIAKRAKVRPSTPSRELVDPINPLPGPLFYQFVTQALEIAAVLIKAIERVRGKIGDYREGAAGLLEGDLAEYSDTNRPDDFETRSG
jgi:hypothetical protein